MFLPALVSGDIANVSVYTITHVKEKQNPKIDLVVLVILVNHFYHFLLTNLVKMVLYVYMDGVWFRHGGLTGRSVL